MAIVANTRKPRATPNARAVDGYAVVLAHTLENSTHHRVLYLRRVLPDDDVGGGETTVHTDKSPGSRTRESNNRHAPGEENYPPRTDWGQQTAATQLGWPTTCLWTGPARHLWLCVWLCACVRVVGGSNGQSANTNHAQPTHSDTCSGNNARSNTIHSAQLLPEQQHKERESDPHLFLRWATPSVQRLSHRHQAAHETPSTRTPLPPPPPSSLRHPRSLCHWQRRRWVVAASCSGLCALCHPQHRAHRNMDRYLTLSKHHHPLTNAWRSGSEPLQCSTSCVLLVAGYFVKRLQWHWVLLRV